MTSRPEGAGTTQGIESVPLVAEVAHVAVHDVVTGRVRVSTQVETFEQLARADLHSESVEVTRVVLNQQITGDLPQIRTEGEVTIVPVFEEVLVVEKRLVLKEELHIRKHSLTESVSMPVTLRHQTATVEHLDECGR